MKGHPSCLQAIYSTLFTQSPNKKNPTTLKNSYTIVVLYLQLKLMYFWMPAMQINDISPYFILFRLY